MPSALRPKLQLALGRVAILADALPDDGATQRFAASAPDDGATLQVFLYAAPPVGPSPHALRERVAQLRTLAHPGLIVPRAVGDVDGRAWAVDMAPVDAMAWRRVLTLREGVDVMREITRALVALHRRGLAHGAVRPEYLYHRDDQVRLGGLAQRLDATPREDLDALAVTAWTLLTGEATPRPAATLSSRRRGVPPELDALFATLLAADPARRPARAEAVLDAMDAFPLGPRSSLGTLLDGVERGARMGSRRRVMVLLGLMALVLAFAAMLVAR